MYNFLDTIFFTPDYKIPSNSKWKRLEWLECSLRKMLLPATELYLMHVCCYVLYYRWNKLLRHHKNKCLLSFQNRIKLHSFLTWLLCMNCKYILFSRYLHCYKWNHSIRWVIYIYINRNDLYLPLQRGATFYYITFIFCRNNLSQICWSA